jgi:hypothetical protein
VLEQAPILVRFTAHAARRGSLARLSLAEVERAVLEDHHRRRRNPGDTDWLLTRGRVVIAYNHPDAGDLTTALVVTVWRRG